MNIPTAFPEEPFLQPQGEFVVPVAALGAVAATAGNMAAAEVVKLITGLSEPLAGVLLTGDLRSMTFRRLRIRRGPRCAICSSLTKGTSAQ